jgi:hypothetical protein
MPPAMGQPINVVEKPSSTPGIARFETNRSLTGMGHERYLSAEDVIDDRPVDELARRLFETGGVTQVHANGSMVTVHLSDGWTGARLLDVIRGLYVFYPPAAPTEEETVPEAEPASEAETAAEAQDTPDTAAEPHQADEATAEQEPAPQPEVVPEPESSISAGVEPAAEPDLEPAPDQDPEAVADAEVEAAELEANGPEADQPEPAPDSDTERAPAGTKSPK